MAFLQLFVCVVAIILSTKFLLNWFKNRRFWALVNEIPGPPTIPVIGNALQISGLSPEELFRMNRINAARYRPIYKIKIFSDVFVNIIDPDDIEQLLTDMKHIGKSELYHLVEPWLGTGLLTSSGAKWQTRRKILTPAFHFNILQEFLKVFNDETRKLVEDLKVAVPVDDVIDVVAPITQCTLWSIAETAMGLGRDMTQSKRLDYQKAVYRMGELFITRLYKPWLHKDFAYKLTSEGKEAKQLLNTLHGFSRSVIEERKQIFQNSSSSYEDRKRLAMLDLLLRHQAKNADIDDEGIREEVDTFMFGGHDTTSMALCLSLMLLANHPQIQEELLSEIEEVIGDGDLYKDNSNGPTFQQLGELKFMERCIKETLRIYPSAPLVARRIAEDIHTHTGYTIPKGCQVLVRIRELHHDPSIYPEPEKFDPDRFLPDNVKNRHRFAYIPFSAGARNCIGQKFAILEMKAVLCGILTEFKLEAVDTPDTLVFCTDLVMRSKYGIKVKFVPRHPEKK